nr:phosphatidylinositol N-acetylglucosaminyltransferase subunit H-like [Pocillopora verrucosa]
MKNQQRELNGLSIHGQSLKVSFKGDGVLTSSIEIERSRQTPSGAFFLVFFLSSIVGTVALPQELLSLTSLVVWTFVVVAIVLLKLYCWDIHKESVLIVKDLGIQYTKSCVLGLQTSQFIEHHKIVDVLINEVITMHQVVCYLTLLISEGKQNQPRRKHELLPLFMATVPNLVTIKSIYHGMQKILGT